MSDRPSAQPAGGSVAADVVAALASCREIHRILVYAFDADGGATVLASGPGGGTEGAATESSMSEPNAIEFYLRAAEGPWAEAGRPHPRAFVPIRHSGDTVGVVELRLMPTSAADREQLQKLTTEVSPYEGALGQALRLRGNYVRSLARVRSIIDHRAFAVTLEPVVDRWTRAVVGYMAVVRFSDGSPPDRVLDEAAEVGLADELEMVTVRGVLDASTALPAEAWLMINVTSRFLGDGELRGLLGARKAQTIVLRLTDPIDPGRSVSIAPGREHHGSEVRFAIRVQAADLPNLEAIEQVEADFVTLDATSIHRIAEDQVRQALVRQLASIARTIGAAVVADGVETLADADELLGLGISLVHGPRLGWRPQDRRPTPTPRSSARPTDDVVRALNIGPALAGALRDAGLTTIGDLRAIGAVGAWVRLQRVRPRIATGATLLKLEGAAKGIRITQLPPDERARLRSFARRHQLPE